MVDVFRYCILPSYAYIPRWTQLLDIVTLAIPLFEVYMHVWTDNYVDLVEIRTFYLIKYEIRIHESIDLRIKFSGDFQCTTTRLRRGGGPTLLQY